MLTLRRDVRPVSIAFGAPPIFIGIRFGKVSDNRPAAPSRVSPTHPRGLHKVVEAGQNGGVILDSDDLVPQQQHNG